MRKKQLGKKESKALWPVYSTCCAEALLQSTTSSDGVMDRIFHLTWNNQKQDRQNTLSNDFQHSGLQAMKMVGDHCKTENIYRRPHKCPSSFDRVLTGVQGHDEGRKSDIELGLWSWEASKTKADTDHRTENWREESSTGNKSWRCAEIPSWVFSGVMKSACVLGNFPRTVENKM